jgi:hypothetical protein
MLKRESIAQEFWKRIAGVTDVVYTSRNPKAPPGEDNLPASQFFEFEDKVVEVGKRGDTLVYKRRWTIVLEMFTKSTAEAASSKELMDFVEDTRLAIYDGGPSLGGLCELHEVDSSRVLRPPAGENIAGIGISFEINYVEEIELKKST